MRNPHLFFLLFGAAIAPAALLSAGTDAPVQQSQLWDSLPPPPTLSLFEEVVCEGLRNTHQCARAIEEERIGRSRGVVERTPAGLRLKMDEGDWLDVPDESDAAWPSYFSYLGYLRQIQHYVLWEQHPEGAEVRLVQRSTGWMRRVGALPLVDPSGHRIVVSVGGYDIQSVLSLLRTQGDTLALEWEVTPRDWSPLTPIWIDAERVDVLRRYMVVCGIGPGVGWDTIYGDTVTVSLRGSEWELTAPEARSAPDSIARIATECWQYRLNY